MAMKKTFVSVLKDSGITHNPTFVAVLGMCPTLAVTNSATNGFGMGIAVTFVLFFSSFLVSLMRKFIPDQVRIPSFIVVIASFSTIVEMLLKAYFPALNKSLGIFIPLIVVNCIILERAESFASKNTVVATMADSIGTGLGFTVALTILGCIREFLGTGSIFALKLLPEKAPTMLGFVMAPGGFITLGIVLGVIAAIRAKTSRHEGGNRA